MLKVFNRSFGWQAVTLVTACLVAFPIFLVGRAFLTPSWEVWLHLWQTRLGEMVINTLSLLIGVGAGTLTLGTALAWIVVFHKFPGRRIIEWLLILPMTMPGYVMAFVALSIFSYTGPVQTALRASYGPDIWFPDIRSTTGVVIIMTLVLYPYVYLLARAAFLEQGTVLIDAARSLGHSRMNAFFRIVLPMARPSLAAGLTLVLMETIADLGAVGVLGFPTLTTGVYRVWIGLQEKEAAMQLAAVLLIFAVLLLVIERKLRRGARYTQTGGRSLTVEPVRLTGWRGWAATGFCLTVVCIAFGLPSAQLISWASSQASEGGLDSRYFQFAGNSLILAGITAMLAVFFGLIMAYGGRLHPHTRRAIDIAAMGYAVPGAVVGVGIVAAVAIAQGALDGLLSLIGKNSDILLSGSVTALIYAYLVRFMAVAYRPVEASLGKVTESMDMAARSLGASPATTLRRIHAPLMGVGILTGAVLVFVDVMKELPATLFLRPIGYDTLATRVWQFTTEALWEQAALPALTIVLAGIIPAAIIIHESRRIRDKRFNEKPAQHIKEDAA